MGGSWGPTRSACTGSRGFGYLPVPLASSPAGGALFSSLTRIQNQIEALRDAYLESFSYAIVLIVPASVGLSVLAPEIV